jgi:hypothetical protein
MDFSIVFQVYDRLSPYHRFWPTHIDSRSIEPVLDMRSIELLNHLDAGPAVLRNLVDKTASAT